MDRPDTREKAGGLREGDVLTRRYLLLEQIAEGGMSVIWRAFDQTLQRMVAVKVLDGSFDGDHAGRDLIRREARATARLIHPDVTEVYDYGETITSGGRLAAYVVMRLLEGQPLAERLADGPLPWAEATAIAANLAEVLANAHERGIVHRDVTPENVLLTADGTKLMDFGIAALAGEPDDERAAESGTPPYVAPERLQGVNADPAIDVYSLGAVYYEMLTGSTPYPETTWEGIETARRTGPPPIPSGVPGLPPHLAALCQSCLANDPRERPTAQHVADVLGAAISDTRRSGRAIRRRWVAVAGVAAAFTGWAVGLSVSSPGRDDTVLTVAQPTHAPVVTVTASAPAPSEGEFSAEPDPLPEATIEAEAGEPEPAPTPSRARGLAAQPREEEIVQKYEPSVTPTTKATHAPPVPKVTVAPGPATLKAPTVAEAVGGFDTLLDEGLAKGNLPQHVAQDLRQLLRNATHNPSTAEVAIADLRRKLADREREGNLSSGLRAALDRQLTVVADALARNPQKA